MKFPVKQLTLRMAHLLPVVNIIVDGADEGTASDVKGQFTLSTKHSFPFSINISHIGYDPLIIAVENDSLSKFS